MNLFPHNIKISSPTIDIFFVLESLSIIVIIFFIVTIKMECVKLGYEIYNLSQEIERKKLQLQDVTEIHDEIMQPEKLYKAAKDLDMHFPEPDRVYYVE